MTNEEMKAALLEANTALVEKIGKQPFIPLSLHLMDDGKWHVGGAYLDTSMEHRVGGKSCDTTEDAFASAMEVIASIQDEEGRRAARIASLKKQIADLEGESQ